MTQDLLRKVVGLTATEAAEVVVAAGLDPVLVGSDTTALTMDYRPLRVRLFLDESGVVANATQG